MGLKGSRAGGTLCWFVFFKGGDHRKRPETLIFHKAGLCVAWDLGALSSTHAHPRRLASVVQKLEPDQGRD